MAMLLSALPVLSTGCFVTLFLRSLIFLLLSLSWCAPGAWARLDGEAEWSYAHFEQSSDNGEDLTASHFTQRYSLMYRTKGLLAEGRAGFYDFGLGAEWGAYESDFDGETVSNDALKYLYEGRLQIAPGGLPVRLNAYSFDLQKIQFNRANGPYSADSTAPGIFSLINPRIVNDLHNGQTIVSGVQFMAGIRNGTYLGKYREILSQWPRILVDYRDVYRSDMKSRTPQKYRDQDLAFVSLNKRDNWFHYRVYTHKDYLRPENDERKNTIMLGTIDHTLKRQWIDLSNWIRISVDGAYTEYERKWDGAAEERFDVNFFATMDRRDFSASTLANMQRVKRWGRLENVLDIPVFYNRSINPDTSLRSAFQVWRQNEIDGTGVFEDRNEDAFYAKLLLETQKRSRVQITPSIEMEVHTGDKGEGEAIRGRVEAYSNRLMRQKTTWYGMGSLARFDGASAVDDKMALWEGELQGALSRRVHNNVLVGGDQYFLYGTGSYGPQTTHFMRSLAGEGFGRLSSSSTTSFEGSLFRSKSTLYLEHTSSSKMTNRFQLFYKFQDSSGERLDSLELSHRLRYQSGLWRVNLEHFYVTGDDSDYLGPGSGYLGQVSDVSSFKQQIFQKGTVEFRPNNYWMSRLDSSITWGQGRSGENNLLVQIKQRVERTFYASGSVRRKRGDITQSLIYEQFKDGIDKRAVVFSLAGNYFPTSYWRLGADVSYYDYDFQSNAVYYSLTTGLDFPLFKVDFRYDYGASDYANTVAHRYEVNVKKTF